MTAAYYREVMSAWSQSRRRRRDRPGRVPALLVGQAAPHPVPGTTHVPLFPYPRGCAGERLLRLSGWSLEDWFTEFDTVDTLEHFPSRMGRGDSFPLREAREAAASLEVSMGLRERVVVFVGKANAGCYPWALPEPFAVVPQSQGGLWAWVPHTSGLVTSWNDPGTRELAREMFSGLREKLLADPT